MKTKLILLCIGLATLLGCAAWQKTWPTIAECAAPAAADLVAKVGAILAKGGSAEELSAEGVAALEQLASTYGYNTVACVVKQLIGGMRGAESTPAAARGRAFLRIRGVQ